jgi:hypothetical protein
VNPVVVRGRIVTYVAHEGHYAPNGGQRGRTEMAPSNSLTSLFPSRPPQLNHVAMTLPIGALDTENRRAITRFYRDVFGWRPVPTMADDSGCLVLSMNGSDQFLYMTTGDTPMRAQRMDHFGVSVGALDELEGVHERACAYREHDPRVHVVAPALEDHTLVVIHNMYVGYLLPLTIEVQFWELRDAG